MKRIVSILLSSVVVTVLLLNSCKKDHSCETCGKKNKPPIANAGRDTTITLPNDSSILDGSASSDPDGAITHWLWTKISGPGSFVNIVNNAAAKTTVKNLSHGNYQFELKVWDNDGLYSMDTVKIVVDSTVGNHNHAPVANAGLYISFSLPVNFTTLNGSASFDVDNNIISYSWTKISGPSSFYIANPNAVQTQVNNLVQGVYQFELTVTDADSLFSKDTVTVSVLPIPTPAVLCEPFNRPTIPAQLNPFGILSETRTNISIASAGNKILFAGGYNSSSGAPSSTVDIYDLSSNTWSVAQLSQARAEMTTVVAGNKIFFAGGTGSSTRVDIFDVVSNVWTTADLSLGRTSMTAATVGNQVFFAGGISDYGGPPQYKWLFSDRVDIFNTSTNTWSTSSLSWPRGELASAVVNNKVYFAGGTIWYDVMDYDCTARIDIYDAGTGLWSVDSLVEAKGGLAGNAMGNKIYWAGGRTNTGTPPYESCVVEIKDGSSQLTTHLFEPNSYFNAVQKDSKLIFFTTAGNYSIGVLNQFDIYDTNTNSWSIGILSSNVQNSAIYSVNNTIYLAGASINGIVTNQVWKLDF